MQNIVGMPKVYNWTISERKIINLLEFHVVLSDSVDDPAEYDFLNEFDL